MPLARSKAGGQAPKNTSTRRSVPRSRNFQKGMKVNCREYAAAKMVKQYKEHLNSDKGLSSIDGQWGGNPFEVPGPFYQVTGTHAL
jgi:hypothetical protein